MVLKLLLLDLIAFLSFVFFTEQSADSQQAHCRMNDRRFELITAAQITLQQKSNIQDFYCRKCKQKKKYSGDSDAFLSAEEVKQSN